LSTGTLLERCTASIAGPNAEQLYKMPAASRRVLHE
jgi:hypothetical protein